MACLRGKLTRTSLTSATPYPIPPGGETTSTRVTTENGKVTTDGKNVDRSRAAVKAIPILSQPRTDFRTSELLVWIVTSWNSNTLSCK